MLSVRDLSVELGGRRVLHGVSLEVRRGEIVAVLGPNGSGKTTLLEAIAGFRPANGAITLGAAALTRFSQRVGAVAYLPDEVLLPEELSLATALALSPQGALVRPLGLAELLQARASTLSRGEAKRAQLCATLASTAELLLLDEPFGALDPRQLRDLVPVFRDATRDRAVLVTVHQMSTAERVADRVVLLSEGHVVAAGTVDELRARAGGARSLDETFLALLDAEAAHGP